MHDNANITFIYPFILSNPQNIKIQNKSITNPIKKHKNNTQNRKTAILGVFIFLNLLKSI